MCVYTYIDVCLKPGDCCRPCKENALWSSLKDIQNLCVCVFDCRLRRFICTTACSIQRMSVRKLVLVIAALRFKSHNH